MTVDKNIMTDTQAQRVVEILMQYAPEGWTSINLNFYSDDELTRITTCAQTPSVAEHGFQLDEADADSVESVFSEIMENNKNEWNTAEFIVSADGDFSVTFSKN